MTYNNYRLIINGITITNDLVQKGSYKATPQKRVVATWLDANFIEHQDVLPTRKMDIQFSLRQRSLSEQDSLKGIFVVQENISVTYWDDKTCAYKTGTFRMEEPEFSHISTVGGINYAETPIHLIEY